MLLDGVQYHERRRAFHGVMRNQFVNFAFEVCWDDEAHGDCLQPIPSNSEIRVPKSERSLKPEARRASLGACISDFVILISFGIRSSNLSPVTSPHHEIQRAENRRYVAHHVT